MGTEGEDVVADEGGGLKLRMPLRFQHGTVKAAAWQVCASHLAISTHIPWCVGAAMQHAHAALDEELGRQVLAEAGPAGLSTVEIAKRIQQQGLRDLRTSKTPEVGRSLLRKQCRWADQQSSAGVCCYVQPQAIYNQVVLIPKSLSETYSVCTGDVWAEVVHL